MLPLQKILGKSYTFSYGIPGIPRVYGCSRWWCKLWRKLALDTKLKRTLLPFVKKLHELVK